jgi:hypothetical protein
MPYGPLLPRIIESSFLDLGKTSLRQVARDQLIENNREQLVRFEERLFAGVD